MDVKKLKPQKFVKFLRITGYDPNDYPKIGIDETKKIDNFDYNNPKQLAQKVKEMHAKLGEFCIGFQFAQQENIKVDSKIYHSDIENISNKFYVGREVEGYEGRKIEFKFPFNDVHYTLFDDDKIIEDK